MTISFALGLPHTPWVPARKESFERLTESLGLHRAGGTTGLNIRIFDEQEPNWSWSQRLWKWACGTGATHLVQLQDDAEVSPNFWPALRAMVSARPGNVIGLEAAHPLGPEMMRTGRRWYRTRAWLIGVGYVWPLDRDNFTGLPHLVEWCSLTSNRKVVESSNEDSLASRWLTEAATTWEEAYPGRGQEFDVWHPVPTIIDHDTSVPSTYGNDGHHEFSMYRRPTVTWRDVPRIEALEEESYWRCSEAPLLPGAGTQKCWYCGEEEGRLTSDTTGARIGPECLAKILGHMLTFIK